MNAYLADLASMDGAKLIGSVLRRACDVDRAIFDGFLDLMQRVVRTAIQEAIGSTDVEMTIESAPEHERAGNA